MTPNPALPAERPPFALVVTADDFGIGLETSKGIIEAHRNGPVTATSLMSITGDHVRASLPLLDNTPDLDVGLHLVLTHCGEKPLMARESSGLVGRDGYFHTNGKLWQLALRKKLQQRAIADEIAAQAEMFRKLMGRAPDYVDCHHHAHQLPIIREALLEVIQHDLLPRVTRVTLEPPGMMLRVGSVRLKRLAAQWMGSRAAKAFSLGWLWTNDSYFGMLAERDLERQFPWDKYLENLRSIGIVEWVVHPGKADDSLAGRDGYRQQRVVELNALTGSDGVAAWEKWRPFFARKSVLARLPVPG